MSTTPMKQPGVMSASASDSPAWLKALGSRVALTPDPVMSMIGRILEGGRCG